MNKINYQKELEKIIEYHERKKEVPTLLLHACCAPCSSYVLEYLSKYFKIDILFYNPNIETDDEYRHRAEELARLISEMEFEHPVTPIIEQYEPEKFYKYVEGLEKCREGGNRCFKCYELRLTETATIAAEKHYDYFTTTLSISPLKNADKLNEIGKCLEEKYGVKYLSSDFKKKNGYKRSIELSKEYQLYRQNFCGCKFSKSQNSGDIELKPNE
ncbi:MAG: epoxyqueuosine reductase QueH [Eubacterium sp.]|nr:epoxyqueuosine reductase QueH [Eubacterium sp.]